MLTQNWRSNSTYMAKNYYFGRTIFLQPCVYEYNQLLYRYLYKPQAYSTTYRTFVLAWCLHSNGNVTVHP